MEAFRRIDVARARKELAFAVTPPQTPPPSPSEDPEEEKGRIVSGLERGVFQLRTRLDCDSGAFLNVSETCVNFCLCSYPSVLAG